MKIICFFCFFVVAVVAHQSFELTKINQEIELHRGEFVSLKLENQFKFKCLITPLSDEVSFGYSGFYVYSGDNIIISEPVEVSVGKGVMIKCYTGPIKIKCYL